MAKANWKYNCMTGHDILNVGTNGRVIRTTFHGATPVWYLYQPEFWGPDGCVKGDVCLSLSAAKRELARLAKV